MEFYESNVGMANLTKDGDRLNWWRNHEKQLPLLSKVARQVLGVSCSSAKSERVFSTGGFMVTKRRNRLGSARVEGLLLLKENKKLVDEFHKKSVKKVKDNDVDAFKAVVIETEEGQNIPPPRSALFEVDVVNEEDEYEDSSDDDFEVTIDDTN